MQSESMYGYPRPIFFKVEKIFGFLLLLIGIFVALKLVGVLDANLLVPNEYLVWFTAAVCILFGFVLVTHQQHGYH